MRGLLLLFIVVPLLELYLLTLLARATSFWWAVALTVVTGVVGGTLAKREGLRVWTRWQRALARMQVPEEGVVEGLLVLVGGVLLITPGVLTDCLGFLLLLPSGRRLAVRMIKKWLDRRLRISTVSMPPGFLTRDRDEHPSATNEKLTSSRQGAIDTTGSSLDP
jgi:UPF0716 protein FxsA